MVVQIEKKRKGKEHKNTMSRHTLSRIIYTCTITWHMEFSDMMNSSKNFLYFMSIISHIVNHLNSLIQSRTISVDLTSNILRKQSSTTYWSDAVWDLLILVAGCYFTLRENGSPWVDTVTQCWQTLTFHKLKYNIRGCSSPNFAKNCIESTIHGLLSMT